MLPLAKSFLVAIPDCHMISELLRVFCYRTHIRYIQLDTTEEI